MLICRTTVVIIAGTVLDRRGCVNCWGALWESFVIAERLKRRLYQGPAANDYFWRTWDGQKIDLIEERDGRLYAYEAKWSPRRGRGGPPRAWRENYPDSEYHTVTPHNCMDFLL